VAEPVILFNSSTGSDTAASGAGPIPAISGTNAAHTGGTNQNTITFTNNPNLSGISTNGTAVLWLKTSSGRQYSKITAVNNSTKQVTVADLFNISSGSAVNYAIGGRRATFNHTDSRKLLREDIKPGWVVETETDQTLTSGAINVATGVGGDNLQPITVRGSSEFKTIASNSECFILILSGTTNWKFERLKFTSNGSDKTNANGIRAGSTNFFLAINCIFGDITNSLGTGVYLESTGSHGILIDSEIGYTTTNLGGTGIGIRSVGTVDVHGCWIHDNYSGFSNSGNSSSSWQVYSSLIMNNQTNGVNLSLGAGLLYGCTIHGNNVGLKVHSVSSRLITMNNLFSNNVTGVDAPSGQEKFILGVNHNNYYNNTTDRVNFPIGPEDTCLNPQYVNPGGNNFMVGTNLRATGFPAASRGIGANQNLTNSFVDIGAAQRQEAT
jgi:hypothetical protein